jgi:FkbH-like protein
MDLYWLPECSTWKESLAATRANGDPWPKLVELALKRLDFVKTNQLDGVLRTSLLDHPTDGLSEKPLRLAVLASSTATHLAPGLRVAALRRGIRLEVYEAGYGQYRQEVLDGSSALHRFHPEVVLLALDTRHVLAQMGNDNGTDAAEKALAGLAELWQKMRATFGCQVLQQTLLPVFPANMGSNEHRLNTSRHWRVSAFNHALRRYADTGGVDLLALDDSVEQHGVGAWYDDSLWHKAKQEIHPSASPMYGELAIRLIAAQRGRSSKCLVLDLDNTLWGGVIGDDGLEGIVLGQGNAVGEAYVEFQRWVLEQTRRGVILAVCSKNDEANALLPFERHPEMVLSRSDIALLVANWDDKATNLRMIAQRLNIGLDSLVFADDNPFERNIVRSELPQVSVPELPEDPVLYARCLADAGYFEALSLTADDLERSRQYQANLQRETMQAGATDLDAYLASLKMQLSTKPLNTFDLKRVVQLINKTNQFNLTTRRYSEAEVEALLCDNGVLGLQFRLTDSFGDNGIISVIMGKLDQANTNRMIIDSWLMSCRVLGRHVETACLNVLVAKAKDLGVTEIVGEYIPTAKNGMVRDHYGKLTFLPVRDEPDGRSVWRLPLDRYVPFDTFIAVHEE